MSQSDLTLDERHQILSVLQQLDPSAPRESRRNARRKTLLEVEIRMISGGKLGKTTVAVLANVAKKGVAVLLEKPTALGQKFVLLLEFDDGTASLALCEVRNSVTLASGLHKTGAQFIAKVEDAVDDTPVPEEWLH